MNYRTPSEADLQSIRIPIIETLRSASTGNSLNNLSALEGKCMYRPIVQMLQK